MTNRGRRSLNAPAPKRCGVMHFWASGVMAPAFTRKWSPKRLIGRFAPDPGIHRSLDPELPKRCDIRDSEGLWQDQLSDFGFILCGKVCPFGWKKTTAFELPMEIFRVYSNMLPVLTAPGWLWLRPKGLNAKGSKGLGSIGTNAKDSERLLVYSGRMWKVQSSSTPWPSDFKTDYSKVQGLTAYRPLSFCY